MSLTNSPNYGWIVYILIISSYFTAPALGSLYSDLAYDSLRESIINLKSKFAVVSSAHEKYGHAIVKDGAKSCSPDIIRISDMTYLAKDRSRPQVLISGEIHGDERVGPGVTIPLIEIMAWSADCLIKKESPSCEKLDNMGGITFGQRTWLAHLATRRETIVIPTANCMGYIKSVRQDGQFDPNRDYPYVRTNSQCFLSSSSRLFKAVMETSIVQSVVTFHGGMVALGYEWGSRNHMRPKDKSPDDNAHRLIAELMGRNAGKFGKEKAYPVGRINSLIYPVDGGMEDWLYAAGWDKSQVRKCSGVVDSIDSNKDSNKDSDKEGSSGEGIAENRAVVFLVETSDRKKPLSSALGGSEKILDPSAPQNGHIPRNVRLSLTAIDMVQPYVCISSGLIASPANSQKAYLSKEKNDVEIKSTSSRLRLRKLEEKRTMSNQTANTLPVRHIEQKVLRMLAPASAVPPAEPSPPVSSNTATGALVAAESGIQVEWYVGGGRKVDCTFLAWHEFPNNISGDLSTADWTAYMDSLDTPTTLQTFKTHCEMANKENEARVANRRVAKATPPVPIFPLPASSKQEGYTRWYPPTTDSSQNGESASFGKSFGTVFEKDDVLSPHSVYRATVYPSFEATDNKNNNNGASASPSTTADVDGSSDSSSDSSSNRGHRRRFAEGRYLLVSWSMVDQDFGAARQGHPSEAVPQAHLSNIRTNTMYHKVVGDRAVKGRLFWPSDPIEVTVAKDGSFAVQSIVTDCAWWDRRTGPSQPSGTPVDAGVQNRSKNDIFDSAAYARPKEIRGSAYKIYVITLGLVLITGMCSVCLYFHLRRSSIYKQLANNKYVNLTSLTTMRGRVTMSTVPSSLELK